MAEWLRISAYASKRENESISLQRRVLCEPDASRERHSLELYVLAQRRDRVAKERAIRRLSGWSGYGEGDGNLLAPRAYDWGEDGPGNEKKIGAFMQDKMEQWFRQAGAIAVDKGPPGASATAEDEAVHQDGCAISPMLSRKIRAILDRLTLCKCENHKGRTAWKT